MIPLPKTAETARLAIRLMERREDGYGVDRQEAKRRAGGQADFPTVERLIAADRRALRTLEKHPFYIIGSSLAFQGLLLFLGCRRFSKRDY
jgi:hypothetical protein